MQLYSGLRRPDDLVCGLEALDSLRRAGTHGPVFAQARGLGASRSGLSRNAVSNPVPEISMVARDRSMSPSLYAPERQRSHSLPA